jgi:hypothetical protein
MESAQISALYDMNNLLFYEANAIAAGDYVEAASLSQQYSELSTWYNTLVNTMNNYGC